MEGGEMFRANNARTGSSSRWRITGRVAFSRSSREEEDEEALKWAALEKLPTYLRVRRGILTAGDGQTREVDIMNLGIVEKKKLLERLVNISDADNEKFLMKLKQRIDRVGLHMPTIEVRFEHLEVEARAYVGSRALPTIFNFCANIIEGFLHKLHILPDQRLPFPILQDVSGIIKPRRMTLLLGPPSSGKTTLLLALAGKLGSDLKISGRVTYNGHEMNEFVPQRTSAYISRQDLHIGEMTVRETMTFSARVQGIGPRYEMLTELLRREKEASVKPDPDVDIYMKAAAIEGHEECLVTDYILKLLGLELCADTMVGDAMFRGISGGEKKRLTTGKTEEAYNSPIKRNFADASTKLGWNTNRAAEMLVGPARAFFMDEISTGLDSSTTFQIVKSLQESIHILNGTALISLLQPAPETYNLFDDIILLSEGHIVYQGPRENVLEFFKSMGFKCPERKGVADFLQEVISREDQKQYWARKEDPYNYVTVREFSEEFQTFHIGTKLGDELADPFDKSKSHPAALATNKYGLGKKDLLKVCISREYLLMKRSWFVYVFKMVQLTFLASLAWSVFFRTEMPRETIIDGGIFFGALFFGVNIVILNGFSELNLTILKLPVFYKQRDLLFYPSWAYSLPTWILKIPISLIEAAIWVILTYYVIGFDPDVGRFLKQYLLYVCSNQMSSGLFRLMAALGRNIIVANAFGSFALLAFMALGGFILSRDDVKAWWIWGYWISPMMYAQNGMAVNEYLGHSWSHIPPNSTESLGIMVMKSRGLFTEAYWYWLAVGVMIGYVLLYNFFFTVALAFLDPFEKPQAMLPKESLAQRKANVMGLGDLSSERENSSPAEEGDKIQHINSPRLPSLNQGRSKGSKQNTRRGMVLPFEPLSIAFDEIRYSVDMPKEMKEQGVGEDRLQLLKGVSGAFRPGILTALMGVTGAGKTTLMDVLAGRKTSGYIEGNITISGYSKKQETFARVAGYCEQTDIHSPHVTVHESLTYSAWLRLSPGVDSASRNLFIEEVMDLVELSPLKEALVGLPGVNGLSKEQRKRLTIAVELVANPSIIFMDEPTSGLDARAAAIVMRTIRNTVDTGRTVVCTIHQPGIDIFDTFDELMVLKRGGEQIYAGPVGRHSSRLIEYFEGISGVCKIKDGYNPATWMLEVASASQEEILGVDFAEIYRNSELFRRNKALIQELSTPLPGSKDLFFPTQYSQSFSTQCMACFWKQNLSYWRNPPYSAVRLLFTTFIALMYGTIFWDLGSKRGRAQDLFNAMGSMYAAVLFIGVQNASLVQPVVDIERTVFYRERAAGMYSALPYALGQIAIEVPYILVQTLIYGLIVYAMIGFEWTAVKFLWFLFFLYFTFLYFTFYGMMTMAAAPDPNIAVVMSSAFYGMWSLFSGFIIPKKRIPIWWRWYYWACPLSWTLYGLFASQFGDIKDKLDTGETVEEFVEAYFGFRHDFLGVVAIVHVGISLVFGFCFGYAIKVFNFQKR